MLGTERQSIPAFQGGKALGDLLMQLDVNQRERSLLTAAALTAIHERVGALPAKDVAPLPEPCAAETSKRVGTRAAAMLRRLLEGEHSQLLPECLALMARMKTSAPPELLPSLLAIGMTKAELREPILSVIGHRGLWLAAQNPDWSWVSAGAPADESIWQTGDKTARAVFFRQVRRSNPARAIELLGATWKEETPEDRAAFVAELSSGLSSADEPFLEAALDDKRKEVRRAAAVLLARLPESGFVRRMTERVRPLLSFKRARKSILQVTLPAECDKATQRDGIDVKPPQGFGEKAWWLIQMIENVPLSVWSREWNAAPADILAASQVGDWKKEFLEAWSRAAIRQQNVQWADALFDSVFEADRADRLEKLASVMTPQQREQRVLNVLGRNNNRINLLATHMLGQCMHDWSVGFSRAVLAAMRTETTHESFDWAIRNQFKAYAPFLAPAVLAEAASGWKTETKAWEFWSQGVEEFLAITQFRADLHAVFES